MKNVVECYKHFFGYFNALETNGACSLQSKLPSAYISATTYYLTRLDDAHANLQLLFQIALVLEGLSVSGQAVCVWPY